MIHDAQAKSTIIFTRIVLFRESPPRRRGMSCRRCQLDRKTGDTFTCNLIHTNLFCYTFLIQMLLRESEQGERLSSPSHGSSPSAPASDIVKGKPGLCRVFYPATICPRKHAPALRIPTRVFLDHCKTGPLLHSTWLRTTYGTLASQVSKHADLVSTLSVDMSTFPIWHPIT